MHEQAQKGALNLAGIQRRNMASGFPAQRWDGLRRVTSKREQPLRTAKIISQRQQNARRDNIFSVKKEELPGITSQKQQGHETRLLSKAWRTAARPAGSIHGGITGSNDAARFLHWMVKQVGEQRITEHSAKKYHHICHNRQ